MHYQAFGFTQEDNFSAAGDRPRKGTLTVRVFNRDGRLIVYRQRHAIE